MSQTQAPIDCIIVGYNDIDFQSFAEAQKKRSRFSGAYHEVLTNSISYRGDRVTFVELMNRYIERATGEHPRLNVFEAPALGVCYLKSFLQRRGLRAESVNFFNYDKPRLAALLKQDPRSVVITTTYYIDHAPIVEIVKFVRKHNPNVDIIVGGPHIFNTASDLDEKTQDLVYRHIGANIYIIDSQGEQSLHRVLEARREGASLAEIPNLYYYADGKGHRTERDVETNDLDQNSIDWSFFDSDAVAPVTYMRTARSCPFKCSFCNYPTMAGKHVLADIEVVEKEMRQLKAMGTEYLIFIDDTFNVPLPRFKKLLRMMVDNQFDFKWVSFFRCANADEEAYDLLKASGCIGVFLGIESGDQTILNYMNKSAKVERYRWGVRMLKERGIMTFASIICGFPGETEETVRNSMRFIEESGPTFFNVQLYYHDTRAPISRRSEEFGIEGAGYNWRHNSMDWRGAAEMAKLFLREIENSIPLSLYGFSLWGIPYLLSKGITLEQIEAFGELTRNIMLDQFKEENAAFPEEDRQLEALFANYRHPKAVPA
ncbi:Radical SAM protein [Sulfidibacter corallicola]|uniref:Radical SAM protein n=1 Tax=Sulfidibacter corallicola TaxID=2818388 RepID=A0A8A4TTE0_SULCO|nr:radical SAM protein [Sulfidibacter corallicola]QTD52358.1 radical SAM protein [Sulfidibacter corallicola]